MNNYAMENSKILRNIKNKALWNWIFDNKMKLLHVLIYIVALMQ